MKDYECGIIMTAIIGTVLWSIVCQMTACEEARYRANVEVGVQSSVFTAPSNPGEVK